MPQNNQQPYFPHEANTRNKDKLIRLRIEHGPAGYGVYFMLLERLRSESNFESELDYQVLSFDLNCEIELIRSVITDFGLFEITDDGTMFHSVELNEKMSYMLEAKQKRIDAARRAAECRWGRGDGHNHGDKEAEISQSEDSDLSGIGRLDREMENIRNDEVWVMSILKEFSITMGELDNYLKNFKSVCIGNGIKYGHPTQQDAFKHCRAYINKMIELENAKLRKKPANINKNEAEKMMKSDIDQKKRNEEYEKMVTGAQSPDNMFRNKGYDPKDCSIRQLYDPEWLKNNPPTHPAWIGKFPGKETVEMVMETLKL